MCEDVAVIFFNKLNKILFLCRILRIINHMLIWHHIILFNKVDVCIETYHNKWKNHEFYYTYNI